MAAGITDLLTQATNGTRPVPTTLTAIRAIGATSISCGALTGWPTATAVHFVIYTTDTSGNKVAGSQLDCKGIVSGTTITNIVYYAGNDAGNSIGAIVEAGPTAMWANDLQAWGAVHADQDGTLTAGAVDNAAVLAANVVTTAAIAANSVVTASIAAGIQLPDKMKNPYKFSVYCNAAINSGNGAFALTKFDTKLFDTGANYSTSTGLFTAPIAGFYLFSWLVEVEAPNNQLITSLYKNGADYTRAPNFNITNTNATSSGITKLLQLAANDTIGIYTYCDTTRVISVGSSPTKTNFDGFLVSAT